MTFVTLDPVTGDLTLQLPAACSRFQDELYALLAETFSNQDINENTLENMNRFVADWIEDHPG
jgi:hypothetical protein